MIVTRLMAPDCVIIYTWLIWPVVIGGDVATGNHYRTGPCSHFSECQSWCRHGPAIGLLQAHHLFGLCNYSGKIRRGRSQIAPYT
jgi:hypothetical protein